MFSVSEEPRIALDILRVPLKDKYESQLFWIADQFVNQADTTISLCQHVSSLLGDISSLANFITESFAWTIEVDVLQTSAVDWEYSANYVKNADDLP